MRWNSKPIVMFRPAFLLFIISISGFASCEWQHDEVYEEPITSLTYILTPDSGTAVVLQYLDRDGEGGRPAIINSGTLQANTIYNGEIKLNLLGKHMIDTSSVAEQPEKHQIFFLPQDGLQLTTEYADRDANGYPVGFKTIVNTGSASEGTLTIIIKDQPNKSAPGVADGDLTNAGGSIDAEVSFELTISN